MCMLLHEGKPLDTRLGEGALRLPTEIIETGGQSTPQYWRERYPRVERIQLLEKRSIVSPVR